MPIMPTSRVSKNLEQKSHNWIFHYSPPALCFVCVAKNCQLSVDDYDQPEVVNFVLLVIYKEKLADSGFYFFYFWWIIIFFIAVNFCNNNVTT